MSRQSDRLATLTSGFVGALALGLSIYNVVLQRQQIRAQVWPHLEWSYNNTDGFAFQLHNTGVGPAIVRSARVTVDGVAMDDWHAVQDKLNVATSFPVGFTQSSFNGRVIGAGLMIVTAHFLPIQNGGSEGELGERTNEVGAKYAEQDHRVGVEICYCSTLDECWLFTRMKGNQKVDTCPTYPKEFN